MFIKRRLWKIISTIEIMFKQVIRYIAGAVTKIFSPTDNNYPATGVQPYEGDLADKKSL